MGKDEILVVGAKGLLGGDIIKFYSENLSVRGIGRETMDITRRQNVFETIETLSPKIVINCAGLTNVEMCEKNSELAFKVNCDGAENLASACKKIGAKLIHISTDYVFDGEKSAPYTEDDQPNPISIYSESKLAGEEKVRNNLDDHLIIRTAWIYGFHTKSFTRMVLTRAKEQEVVSVINDQYGCPTYTFDIAEGIRKLLETNLNGTFHLTNEGTCNRYEFTKEIFRLAGLNSDRVKPISSREMNWVARRPKCLELSKEKYKKATGCGIRQWEKALKDYLSKEDLC